jgi:hypothetical protein
MEGKTPMFKVKTLFILLAIPMLFSCKSETANRNGEGDCILQVIIYPNGGGLFDTYHIQLFSDGKIITSFGETDDDEFDENDLIIFPLDFSLDIIRNEKEAFLSENELNALKDLMDLITIDDLYERLVADGGSSIAIIYDGIIYHHSYDDYLEYREYLRYKEFGIENIFGLYFSPHIVELLDRIIEYSPMEIDTRIWP